MLLFFCFFASHPSNPPFVWESSLWSSTNEMCCMSLSRSGWLFQSLPPLMFVAASKMFLTLPTATLVISWHFLSFWLWLFFWVNFVCFSQFQMTCQFHFVLLWDCRIKHLTILGNLAACFPVIMWQLHVTLTTCRSLDEESAPSCSLDAKSFSLAVTTIAITLPASSVVQTVLCTCNFWSFNWLKNFQSLVASKAPLQCLHAKQQSVTDV